MKIALEIIVILRGNLEVLQCNLDYQIPRFIPVVFHNLYRYDSYLFVKKLGEGNIKCIPKTEENYMAFGKDLLVETETIKVKKEKRKKGKHNA